MLRSLIAKATLFAITVTEGRIEGRSSKIIWVCISLGVCGLEVECFGFGLAGLFRVTSSMPSAPRLACRGTLQFAECMAIRARCFESVEGFFANYRNVNVCSQLYRNQQS